MGRVAPGYRPRTLGNSTGPNNRQADRRPPAARNDLRSPGHGALLARAFRGIHSGTGQLPASGVGHQVAILKRGSTSRSWAWAKGSPLGIGPTDLIVAAYRIEMGDGANMQVAHTSLAIAPVMLRVEVEPALCPVDGLIAGPSSRRRPGPSKSFSGFRPRCNRGRSWGGDVAQLRRGKSICKTGP